MNRFNMIKNRLLCAGILAVSISFVFFYGGKVPYALLYTALGLPLVSVGYLFITRLFCEVYCTLDRRDVIKGGDISLTIEIRNGGLLFMPYVNIAYKSIVAFDYDTRDETLSVGPRSGRRARVVLTSKYRGRYDMNIPDVRLMDFLGIVNLGVKYPRLPDVLVYPRVVEIDEFAAVGKFDMDNQLNPDSISEDMTAVSDVREYMNGDSMRRIHWNLSARMLTFMSKNYENITKSRLTLLLNLSRVQGSDTGRRLMLEDRTIEAAVSVVYHFLHRFWNVTLCYYEDDYYTYGLSDASMFGMAYDHLTSVEFKSEYDIARILENISRETAGEYLNLCVVTREMTDDLLDRVIRYSELGSRISIIYICDAKWALEKAGWVQLLKKSPVSLFVYDFQVELREALSMVSQ